MDTEVKANKNSRYISENDFFKLKNGQERIKFLLNYAILAPSTHNTQPWLFKIKGESCEIYKDNKLTLPYADPFGRDLYISIGCAIENLIIASKYFKVFKDIKYYSKENLIAEVFFQNLNQTIESDPKFEKFIIGIKQRLNARGLFENKSIPENIINEIYNLNDSKELIKINILTDKRKIEEVAKLVSQGLEIAYQNKNFRQEMSKWINNNLSKRKDGIPGYALKMPLLISFIFPFLIRNFNLGKKLGYLNYISVRSAPVSILISAKENTPLNWVKVGQIAERIMVYLASENIRNSIFVSAIEMGLSEKLKDIFNTDYEPQFHFCIGYMQNKFKFTPRHKVEDKLLK